MDSPRLLPLDSFTYPCLLRVRGATYYVAEDGDGGNDGLTPNTAFLTIQEALTASVANDIVILLSGTFTGGPFFNHHNHLSSFAIAIHMLKRSLSRSRQCWTGDIHSYTVAGYIDRLPIILPSLE